MPRIGTTAAETTNGLLGHARPRPVLLRAAASPAPSGLVPFWQTTDGQSGRLYHGHVLKVLRALPRRSVQCVVTSPPYWGLRDYGVDGQYGNESRPDCGIAGNNHCGSCYVCNMRNVFREVREVLRDDGTVWLNLGDTYSTQGGRGEARMEELGSPSPNVKTEGRWRGQAPGTKTGGLPSGNLIGVPWRVAFALQVDGWILRQDVIWAKPSPMPESVKNRCTKAHEYVFLLTKSNRYFCDMEAIKEQAVMGDVVRPSSRKYMTDTALMGKTASGNQGNGKTFGGGGRANKRSVWNVSTKAYDGAHFATFPPKLIEPMILAGTSARGCCGSCGAAWRRIVEETKIETRPDKSSKYGTLEEDIRGRGLRKRVITESRTLGWEPACGCDPEHGTVPCTVLDPFVGSGTTVAVALANGCRGIGIELNEEYLRDNAVPRVRGTLLSRPLLAHLAGSARTRAEDAAALARIGDAVKASGGYKP